MRAMPFSRLAFLPLALLLSISPLAACGDDDGGDADDDADDADDGEPGLDDYLPEIPAPTGDAQSVYAGTVDDGNADDELVPGPAASGAVGDLYIRNARGRYIIQAPARVIGVIPQGGNLVDMQPVGPDGPIGEDHFGELSAIYVLGRTCEHESIEVVQDGSGGGVAAIVARGRSAVNDFINIKGIGLLPIAASLDPAIPDTVDCATTYILPPDSPTMEVYWTFFNGGTADISGPFAALNDTGGNVEVWAPTRGFERLGIEAITAGVGPAPVDYAVYQGPGVAYGIVPQHAQPDTPNSSFLIAGVSVVLYGTDELLNIITDDGIYFELAAEAGVTHAAHIVVGQDAADVEAAVLADRGQPGLDLTGEVIWDDGEPVPGARVGVFQDMDGNGAVDPDDVVLSYMDADAEGRFSGPFASGKYLLRADLPDQSRSAVIPSDAKDLVLTLPRPIRFDYEIVDEETGAALPAKIMVIGQNLAEPDQRLHATSDRFSGMITMIQSIRGTSTPPGEEPGDPPIFLAPGSQYRVLVSRGTEWSIDIDTVLSPIAGDTPEPLQFALRRVVDTAGYVSSEYHVHSIGSPDSPVEWPTRVATAAADGIEVFASTEHDYIADLQPVVEELELADWVRVLPGIEVTPFAYGHFNAWPIEPDYAQANHGAVDWARGADGFALTPGEIFGAMRDRGAEMVEVNHPRSLPGSLTSFQNYFDRAQLAFDYDARSISGDQEEQAVPNDWLRLPPGEPLFDISFNALEVWNGFGTEDTDKDGVREIQSLDVVMRDWFNFLSFGLAITPIGNSDTHTIVRDPMGMPRTMVAVADDSPAALADGSIVGPLLDTLAGRGPTPRDIVVTNGPLVRVFQGADPNASVHRAGAGGGRRRGHPQHPGAVAGLGRVRRDRGVRQRCARAGGQPDRAPADQVLRARSGGAGGERSVRFGPARRGGDDGRHRGRVPRPRALRGRGHPHPRGHRPDPSGWRHRQDAWVVVRARGNRAIYPLLLNGILNSENLATLVSGEGVEELLLGNGVPASAFTAPIYLDLDGGGYQAPFAPE